MDITEYIINTQTIVTPKAGKQYILTFSNEEDFIEVYTKLRKNLVIETIKYFYYRCKEGSKEEDKVCIRIFLKEMKYGDITIETGYSPLSFYLHEKYEFNRDYVVVESNKFDLESVLKYIQ